MNNNDGQRKVSPLMKIFGSKYFIRTVIVLLAIVLIYTASKYSFVYLQFKENVTDEVYKMIIPLMFFALITERSLEIFITAWREPAAADLQNRNDDIKKKIKWLETKETLKSIDDKNAAVRAELENSSGLEKEITVYRSKTQRIALITGLVCGIIISAIGVRVFEPLMVSIPAGSQGEAFHWVDIILTGGLIGGGSEGIHKVTTLFADFLDKTSGRINKQ